MISNAEIGNAWYVAISKAETGNAWYVAKSQEASLQLMLWIGFWNTSNVASELKNVHTG